MHPYVYTHLVWAEQVHVGGVRETNSCELHNQEVKWEVKWKSRKLFWSMFHRRSCREI